MTITTRAATFSRTRLATPSAAAAVPTKAEARWKTISTRAVSFATSSEGDLIASTANDATANSAAARRYASRFCEPIDTPTTAGIAPGASARQAFAVLLPVRTVGVMGDGRTYDFVCALRAVTSVDGVTADFYPFEMGFLGRMAAPS